MEVAMGGRSACGIARKPRPEAGNAPALRRPAGAAAGGARADALVRSVEGAAAAAACLPPALLGRSVRGRAAVVAARQTAIYLMHVCFSLDHVSVAARIGRNRATVADACRAVEERRDDPRVDLALAQLELALTRWCATFRQEARR
jgi:hypothetical protein